MPAHAADPMIDAFLAHASGPIRPQGRPLNAVEVEMRDRMRARMRAGPVEAVPPPSPHERSRGSAPRANPPVRNRTADPALVAEKEKFDRLYDDGEVWCTLVPERTVPAGARCIAADVADRAALRLGIWDDPTLVWFRKADAATAADLDAGRRSRDDVLAFRQRPTIRAFTMRDDPHVVYLDANMPPDNVPHVVAHELRHVWQQQAHRGQYVGQWAEDDAEAFARKFIR